MSSTTSGESALAPHGDRRAELLGRVVRPQHVAGARVEAIDDSGATLREYPLAAESSASPAAQCRPSCPACRPDRSGPRRRASTPVLPFRPGSSSLIRSRRVAPALPRSCRRRRTTTSRRRSRVATTLGAGVPANPFPIRRRGLRPSNRCPEIADSRAASFANLQPAADDLICFNCSSASPANRSRHL